MFTRYVLNRNAIRKAISSIVDYGFDIVAITDGGTHTYVCVKPDFVHKYSTVRYHFRVNNKTQTAERYHV